MNKPIVRKLKKNKYEIIVTGNRYPRGSDNEITVEVNEKDELIITTPKVQRCYAYERTIENDREIQIIAK